jgi:hypothetical protein
MAANRQPQQTHWLIQLFEAIFRALSGGGSKVDSATMARLTQEWGQVDRMLNAGGAGAAQAVSTADKLLDAALKAHGFGGGSFADRLRAAEGRFSPSTYQSIWSAHKLRNRLAHEIGVDVDYREAVVAVQALRSGFDVLNR